MTGWMKSLRHWKIPMWIRVIAASWIFVAYVLGAALLGIWLSDMPWWGYALTSIGLVAFALGPINWVYGKLLPAGGGKREVDQA